MNDQGRIKVLEEQIDLLQEQEEIMFQHLDTNHKLIKFLQNTIDDLIKEKKND